MQSHMSIYNVDIDDVKRSIEAFAAFGVRLHVTELDISLYDPKDRSLPAPLLTDEMFERQAQLYIDLFKVYREYADVIDNVTTWGVADDYTWLSNWPVRGRTNYPPFSMQITVRSLSSRRSSRRRLKFEKASWNPFHGAFSLHRELFRRRRI